MDVGIDLEPEPEPERAFRGRRAAPPAERPAERPAQRLVRRTHVACAAAYGAAALACFAASSSAELRVPMTVSYLRRAGDAGGGAPSAAAVAGATSVGTMWASAAVGTTLAIACAAAACMATLWRGEVGAQVLLGISGPRHAERAVASAMLSAVAAAVAGASDVYLFAATFALAASSHALLLACDFVNEGWASERGEPSLYLLYCALLPAAVAAAVPLGFLGGAVGNGVDVPGFVHAAVSVSVLYAMLAPALVYLRFRSRRGERRFAAWEAVQAGGDLVARLALAGIVAGGALARA